MTRTITLHLDGEDISTHVFVQKLNAFLDLLRQVDRAVTEELETEDAEATSIKWVIESIRSGSPVDLTLRADPLTDTVGAPRIFVGERVISAVATGLAVIESPAELADLPPYFTFQALEDVQKLTRPSSDGLTGLEVRTPELTVPLSGKVNKNLRRFLAPAYEHDGSVEGYLQMVSVAGGGLRCSIRDRMSGRTIPCRVPKELQPAVVSVFDRRVSVHGRVRTNERGDVLSIRLEQVEAFPPESELPNVNQVAGAFDLTLGKSVRQHLDNLRDAS